MIKPFYFIKPRLNFDLGFTPEMAVMLTNMMLFYGGALQAPISPSDLMAKIIASAARITSEECERS